MTAATRKKNPMMKKTGSEARDMPIWISNVTSSDIDSDSFKAQLFRSFFTVLTHFNFVELIHVKDAEEAQSHPTFA